MLFLKVSETQMRFSGSWSLGIWAARDEALLLHNHDPPSALMQIPKYLPYRPTVSQSFFRASPTVEVSTPPDISSRPSAWCDVTYPTLASNCAFPTILPMALEVDGSTMDGENSGDVRSYHRLIRKIDGINTLEDEHPASSNAAQNEPVSKYIPHPKNQHDPFIFFVLSC